jgi:formylglycine-generating enzyme required for sulfatase activity
VTDERDGLQLNLDSCQTDLATTGDSLTSVTTERDGLQLNFDSCETDLTETGATLTSVTDERDGLQLNFDSCETDLATTGDSLTSVTDERDGLQGDLTICSQDLSASAAELETAEARIVELESLTGCKDPNASNYVYDDASCEYLGCTDPTASNYDPIALDDNGSCEYLGCTDPSAFNYNPAARVDDGSCEYFPTLEGFSFVAENAQGYAEYTHDETGIEFVLLPGGEFEMGSPDTEEGRSSGEGPVHTVKLSPFLIAKYEVTQAQYEAVMAGNLAGLNATPSGNYGNAPLDPERPVEQVSWNDLKAADGFLDRTGLSLPSEAQWEYACRAGQSSSYSVTVDDMGWYSGNSGGSHHPVGTKQANQFGLFDMHGNVWEWCEDVYDSRFYNNVELRGGPDPVATSGSGNRVIRGGLFFIFGSYCRSANRLFFPSFRSDGFGFRPARPLP